MNLAVGFNPRNERTNVIRRVATIESDNNIIQIVADATDLIFTIFRGLKPTAKLN